MDFDALDRSLRESAQDFTLDAGEKLQLRELGQQLDAARVRFLRNRAFDIAREAMLATPAETLDVLRWPGVVAQATPDMEEVSAEALALLQRVLVELEEMRARE